MLLLTCDIVYHRRSGDEENMLKSCQYCGRIHDSKFICTPKRQVEEKRQSTRKKTSAFSFRKTRVWTNKSLQVRDRDKYMCLCCKAGLDGTVRRYNTKDLSVHHIVPIEEDDSKRLDGSNLITVCGVHHEMCEAGIISRAIQRELVAASMHEAGEDETAELVF